MAFRITPQMMQGITAALQGLNSGEGYDPSSAMTNTGSASAPSTSSGGSSSSTPSLQPPQPDQSGRMPYTPAQSDPAQEMAMQGANIRAAAPKLAAAVEGQEMQSAAQLQGQPSGQQQQAAPGSVPQQPQSALAGSTTMSPEQAAQGAVNATSSDEQSIWTTMLNNLTGQNLQTPEDVEKWRQMQTLGVVGNRLGSAIAGENTPIGRAAGTLGDVFAGNLANKNAEMREASANDWMKQALQGIGGKVGSPTPQTDSSGYGMPQTTLGSAPSTLAAASTQSPTSSLDDVIARTRRLGGI